MARQKGAVQLQGRMGDTIYYKTKNGYLARNKGSLDKKRVSTDPKFEGSRRASSAFGRASSASGDLRRAMGAEALSQADSEQSSRLTAKLYEILKSDPNEDMAAKEMANGDMQRLVGFNWHIDRAIRNIVQSDYEVLVDRESGQVSIHFTDVKKKELKGGSGATHAVLFISAAAIDFATRSYSQGYEESGAIAITGRGSAGEIMLTCNVGADSSLPIVIGLGVKFYQAVNKELHELQGGAFGIVAVFEP